MGIITAHDLAGVFESEIRSDRQENYTLELPTKALLLVLIITTLVIVITMSVFLIKWCKGWKGAREMREIVKLMHMGRYIRHIVSSHQPTESEIPEEVPAPVVASAPEYETVSKPRSIQISDVVETVEPKEVVPTMSTPSSS